jgi:hypothetical protein
MQGVAMRSRRAGNLREGRAGAPAAGLDAGNLPPRAPGVKGPDPERQGEHAQPRQPT